MIRWRYMEFRVPDIRETLRQMPYTLGIKARRPMTLTIEQADAELRKMWGRILDDLDKPAAILQMENDNVG